MKGAPRLRRRAVGALPWVLGLALAASFNAPIPEARFGVFRM